MSDALVPFARQRLSRKRLREWLAEHGPLPVHGILPWVATQAPGVTQAAVEELLASHPTFFEADGRGRWRAVENEPRSVMIRPRPRPPARPRGRRPGARSARGPAERTAPPPRQPPELDELQFENGRLARLVVRHEVPVEGRPYESGGHYLVPIPQREKQAPDDLVELFDLFEDIDQPVELYEIPLGGSALFRGTRTVVQARPVAQDGRVHLVLGPAPDDEGRLLARVVEQHGSPMLLLPPAGAGAATTALLQAIVVTEERLSPQLVKAAAQPSPPAKFDRVSATRQVNIWLQRLRSDRGKWNEFRDWLLRRKQEYDQELIQGILERAIVLFADVPDTVFRLAKLVLEDVEPQPGFAAQFGKALARLQHDPEARAWALELLPAALEAFPEDEELPLAAARLSYADGEIEEAVRRYGEVTAQLEPNDWSDYLLCVSELGDLVPQRRALEAFRARLDHCATPEDLAPMMAALGDAREVALAVKAEPVWWIGEQLRLHLARNEDLKAVNLLETVAASKSLSWEELFDLASLLEEAADALAIARGLTLLKELWNRFRDRMSVPARREVVEQVRALERLVEDYGTSIADELASQIGRNAVQAVSPAADRPLKGQVITIVGGRPLVRQRIEEQLRARGAVDVRHVPPSFEEHFSEARLKAAVNGAHYALELTDCVKHDALTAIRNLQGRGYGFVHVLTSGGPSRVMRDLLSRVGV